MRGIRVSASATALELTDFEIDPGVSVLTGTVSVDGEERVSSAPLFSLDGSTLEPLRTGTGGSVAVLEGTTPSGRETARRPRARSHGGPCSVAVG